MCDHLNGNLQICYTERGFSCYVLRSPSLCNAVRHKNSLQIDHTAESTHALGIVFMYNHSVFPVPSCGGRIITDLVMFTGNHTCGSDGGWIYVPRACTHVYKNTGLEGGTVVDMLVLPLCSCNIPFLNSGLPVRAFLCVIRKIAIN